MNDIVLYRSDNGEVFAELRAKSVNYFVGDNSRTEFPQGVRVVMFNKSDLSDKVWLTAGYAVNYTANSKVVYLRDSIQIINFNSNDTIYCKDLYWDQDEKVVYSYKNIRRYNKSGESFGDGMFSNEQFDSLTVFNPHGKENVE